MALEKTKKNILPPIEEIEIIKSKHRKSPTLCSDQRRQYGNCGICGYSDIAFQGVDHCAKCGKEKDVLYLIEKFSFLSRNSSRNREPLMKCHYNTYTYRDFRTGKICKGHTTHVKRYGIKVCLACGAIKGPACPSCGFDIWHKGCKKYCRNCGYTV